MSFPYELQFPLEKQYLKLHKITTDKDVTIIFSFFFWKTKNSLFFPEICISGGFKEHEKKTLFSTMCYVRADSEL